MLLNYNRLLQDKTLDKRYEGILLSIYKDAPNEYHTTWLIRNGIMKSEELINYLNVIPERGMQYCIPLADKSQYVKMSDYIADNTRRRKFFELCEKHKIFPYKIENNRIHFLAEEREHTSSSINLGEELKVTADTLESLFDKAKSGNIVTVDYTIRPLFEDEHRKFCQFNEAPYNSGDVYRAKPEYLALFYIAKGIIIKASDIYFDPKSDGIKVGYSILNDYIRDDLILLDEIGKKNFNDKVIWLTGIEPKDRPKDVVYDCSIKDLGRMENKYNGRVNCFKNGKVDSICIRVVDKSKKAIPLEELNIRESRKEGMRALAQNSNGIILVAGATGSGKSTTLCSYLHFLSVKYPYRRIETVEDPVEQTIEEISQLTLEDSGATYDDVSQSLTRRNPSILYEGEFNTPKTIHFGVNATLQNLLLISTIHSMDGKSVPDRVRSLTIEQPSIYEQLLQVLRGIIHQTMLKRACPDCLITVSKSDTRITNDMITVLEYFGYLENFVPIVEPKCDCKTCQGRGFIITEPIIAVELCIIDDSLQEDINNAPRNKISKILYEDMRIKNMTGVQDALDYMREQKLDWIQIWNKFSLFNKVRSCVQAGDAKYRKDNFNGIIAN